MGRDMPPIEIEVITYPTESNVIGGGQPFKLEKDRTRISLRAGNSEFYNIKFGAGDFTEKDGLDFAETMYDMRGNAAKNYSIILGETKNSKYQEMAISNEVNQYDVEVFTKGLEEGLCELIG